MKINKLTIPILFSLSLALMACSEELEQPKGQEAPTPLVSQNEVPPPTSHEEAERKPQVDLIFEKEAVEPNTFVSHVRPGDEVRIWITGLRAEPKFSPHQKALQSKWAEQHCQPAKRGLECSYATRMGSCQGKYLDYLGTDQKPIDFKESRPLSLVLRIGEQSYPMEEFRLYGTHTIGIVFQVEESMLKEASALYIDLQPVALSTQTLVGFLGIDEEQCPHFKEREFMVFGDTSSQIISNGPEDLEFLVDLSIVRADID